MKTRILIASLLCLIARQVPAGDAIAMAYNYSGAWTAVTFFRSSTPRNGHHYWSADQAGTFAQRDLRLRANNDLARTKIIGQSDQTGYVTVMRASVMETGHDVTAIGRGNSQKEADENALQKLHATKATMDEKIVYRYFSYGVDAGVLSSAKRENNRSSLKR